MDDKANELFWNCNINEVKSGLIEEEKEFKCIICEEAYEKGRIYEINSALYDAKRATEKHIEETHGSILEYLLDMNSTFTGISEVQRGVLKLISQGLSDKEIAKRLKVADSTIRNHRYKLREKEKQAKFFLSIMELLSENANKNINKLENETLLDAHKSATTIDDRYNITDKEKLSTIKTHMDENGALRSYPVKEKKKIIVLQEIVKNFTKGKRYSEKEINNILKRIYEDYASIRRALIEYGFFERTDDCSSYWVKE
jgi:hypothetical protein